MVSIVSMHKSLKLLIPMHPVDQEVSERRIARQSNHNVCFNCQHWGNGPINVFYPTSKCNGNETIPMGQRPLTCSDDTCNINCFKLRPEFAKYITTQHLDNTLKLRAKEDKEYTERDGIGNYQAGKGNYRCGSCFHWKHVEGERGYCSLCGKIETRFYSSLCSEQGKHGYFFLQKESTDSLYQEILNKGKMS